MNAMNTQMKVTVNLIIHTNACTMLSGYKTKEAAKIAQQGFSSIEMCEAFSKEYGVYTTYYTAHVLFLDRVIASSDSMADENKAIKQAYKLAKEYLEQPTE